MADDCTICAEPLDADISVTRCGHVFHTHCVKTWFEHKPVCPLCKENCPRKKLDSFVRKLRVPAALAPEEEARMRAHAAAGEPSDAVAARLASEVDALTHEISVCAEAQKAEKERVNAKRAAAHKLEAELLKCRRELSAAKRVERSAVEQSEADATLGAAALPPAAEPGPEPPKRAATREAVLNQSRQVAWRCEELRSLEEKIGAIERGMGRGSKRRRAPDENR